MSDQDLLYTIGFSVLLMLLLVSIVVIVIVLANRRHAQQQMKMAQMQLNYEKEMRKAESEIQEQTLSQVSAELHDNIGQLLTLVRIQMEQEKFDRPDLEAALQPADDTLTTAIDQVRSLAKSLNADHLKRTGLLKAIEYEAERLKQIKSFTLHWQHDGEEPQALDDGQKIISFRIFQEVLNNTLKHARAKNISINLIGKDGYRLEVADDGKGFDVDEKRKQGNGSGLANIYKRAALAGLECSLESEQGNGSKFVLWQNNNS